MQTNCINILRKDMGDRFSWCVNKAKGRSRSAVAPLQTNEGGIFSKNASAT
ncbi:hypothetical protein H6G81_13135 [Scytonema hofmannii FACHB-248]|uniref:Uncharacterized protein n=1 Tax=Scytonema hofmannii FACHB-248 TaxID=1842502 RepID=A0ABR8GQX2_9CYAN|nr:MULTISPECIES: hypothetical protein [Nostocales]MBD2605450.1 hypothetical protein [Scytonema hofmannii FACHB-248]